VVHISQNALPGMFTKVQDGHAQGEGFGGGTGGAAAVDVAPVGSDLPTQSMHAVITPVLEPVCTRPAATLAVTGGRLHDTRATHHGE